MPATTTEGTIVDGEPPSGTQTEIRHGDARAVVTEVGACLRVLWRGDLEILDGFGVDEVPVGARGQPLLPWPNRIRDGRYGFGGRDHQLPLTEPPRSNAIHGLTRWVNWVVRERAESSCLMGLVLHPQPGYPFCLDLSIAYRLEAGGLSVETTARNLGADPAPYGAGYHPYVRLGADRVDNLELHVPASSVLEADDRGIPTGRLVPPRGDLDFTLPRSVGDAIIDSAYTGFDRDRDGVARVVVRNPASGAALTIWMDEAHTHVMVFTADTLDAPWRRRSCALEPMTCPPNAFATGDASTLEPGASLRTRWGFAWAHAG